MSIMSTLIPIVITIYIHGTKPTQLVPHDIFKPVVARIENILFVPRTEKRMLSITELNDRIYLQTVAKKYSETNKTNVHDFYFFSWSGKLNHHERKKAAEILMYEINTIIKTYEEQYQIKPIIQLICHSHAGNVALLMEQTRKNSLPFTIDRLILLGCPVQEKTKFFIASPLFKKIYNIYSKTDWVQVLDPQGIHALFDHECRPKVSSFFSNFFSNRHFPHITENMHQVSVKWGNAITYDVANLIGFPAWFIKRLQYANKLQGKRGLFHVELTLLEFISQLPHVIDKIDRMSAENPHHKNNLEIIL